MEKLTWKEFADKMNKANKENDSIKGVIVFSPDSFDKEFSEKSRSYEVSSNAKYFTAGAIGNSLFGNCLDGTDQGVRLDLYMHAVPEDKMGKRWIVDYCYIPDDNNNEDKEVKTEGFSLDDKAEILDKCKRRGQPVALVKLLKAGQYEYIVAFNYEIKDNEISWGYGYYYYDEKSGRDAFEKVKAGGNLSEGKKVESVDLYGNNKSYLEKAMANEVTYWLGELVNENGNDEIGKRANEVLDNSEEVEKIVNELVDGSDDLWEDIHRRIEELAGINYRESSRVDEDYTQASNAGAIKVDIMGQPKKKNKKDKEDKALKSLPAQQVLIEGKENEVDNFTTIDSGNLKEIILRYYTSSGITESDLLIIEYNNGKSLLARNLFIMEDYDYEYKLSNNILILKELNSNIEGKAYLLRCNDDIMKSWFENSELGSAYYGWDDYIHTSMASHESLIYDLQDCNDFDIGQIKKYLIPINASVLNKITESVAVNNDFNIIKYDEVKSLANDIANSLKDKEKVTIDTVIEAIETWDEGNTSVFDIIARVDKELADKINADEDNKYEAENQFLGLVEDILSNRGVTVYDEYNESKEVKTEAIYDNIVSDYKDFCLDNDYEITDNDALIEFCQEVAYHKDKKSADDARVEIRKYLNSLEESKEVKTEAKKENYTLDSIEDAIHKQRSAIARERAYMRRRDSVSMNLSPEADDDYMKEMYDELKRLNAIKRDLQAKEVKTESIENKYADLAEAIEKDIYRYLIDNYEIDLLDNEDLQYDVDEIISEFRSNRFERYCEDNDIELIWSYELDNKRPFGIRVDIEEE